MIVFILDVCICIWRQRSKKTQTQTLSVNKALKSHLNRTRGWLRGINGEKNSFYFWVCFWVMILTTNTGCWHSPTQLGLVNFRLRPLKFLNHNPDGPVEWKSSDTSRPLLVTKWKTWLKLQTRLHSSRMRTDRGSSHLREWMSGLGGGCLGKETPPPRPPRGRSSAEEAQQGDTPPPHL